MHSSQYRVTVQSNVSTESTFVYAFHNYLVVVLGAECHKRQHAQQKPCKSKQHLLSSVPNCPDNCVIEQKVQSECSQLLGILE
jgi:hypothetical protein